MENNKNHEKDQDSNLESNLESNDALISDNRDNSAHSENVAINEAYVEDNEGDLKTAGFNSRKIFDSKLKKIMFIGIGGICLLVLTINIFKAKQAKLLPISSNQTMELDAGSKATDTDRMWRQNLEDKQSHLDKALHAQIENVKTEIMQKAAASDDQKTQEIKHLKEKLQFIQAEFEDKKLDGSDLQINAAMDKTPRITRHVINLSNSKNDKEYEPLKTADNYIPAGTMVGAATLNGLRASTSIQSMSNPNFNSIN